MRMSDAMIDRWLERLGKNKLVKPPRDVALETALLEIKERRKEEKEKEK